MSSWLQRCSESQLLYIFQVLLILLLLFPEAFVKPLKSGVERFLNAILFHDCNHTLCSFGLVCPLRSRVSLHFSPPCPSNSVCCFQCLPLYSMLPSHTESSFAHP